MRLPVLAGSSFRCVALALLAVTTVLTPPAPAAEPAPVVVALDAEFSHATSTSAQAIELGLNCAFEAINAAGGVLGGRPLRLETSDNRSIPARGVANLRQWAARPRWSRWSAGSSARW